MSHLLDPPLFQSLIAKFNPIQPDLAKINQFEDLHVNSFAFDRIGLIASTSSAFNTFGHTLVVVDKLIIDS